MQKICCEGVCGESAADKYVKSKVQTQFSGFYPQVMSENCSCACSLTGLFLPSQFLASVHVFREILSLSCPLVSFSLSGVPFLSFCHSLVLQFSPDGASPDPF